jgi:hypothetical protein
LAIVQISQITNRKGYADNLPQLAGAELGWSTDTRQLWIGNGTLEEGAPIIGNTEILTEFSDILNFSTTYTYEGRAAGYTVQTGPTADTPITLSLQSWFDQFASVLDFGAVGDGTTDCTEAINRALYQLYCREVNPQIRRSLFFPAGVYKVSGTINIPPYATLYGEGADNSVITLVDGGGAVPYVAQTADSLQNTGLNIGSGGATPPQYITINDLGFKSIDPLASVFLVGQATNCRFNNVGFYGYYSLPGESAPTADTDNTLAIDFNTTAAYNCEQILFDNCVISGTVYGVNTNYELQSVTFTNSEFTNLYQGILLGTETPTTVAPTGVRITGNMFNNIYAEGIIFGQYTILNASGHNIFYDVGNHTPGTTPFTSIIILNNSNNVSIGDLFERSDADAIEYPRVYIDLAIDSQPITNGSQIVSALGTYVRQSGSQTELANGDTNIVTTISTVHTKAFEINYTILRGIVYRTGTLLVSLNGTPGGTPIWSDDYVQNDDVGVIFALAQDDSTVTWTYTATEVPPGLNGTINYSINYLA